MRKRLSQGKIPDLDYDSANNPLHEVNNTLHNACLVILKTFLRPWHGTQNTLRRPGTPGVAKLVPTV